MTVVTDVNKRQTQNRWTGGQTQTGPVVTIEWTTAAGKDHKTANAVLTLLPLTTVFSMIETVLLLLLHRRRRQPESILVPTTVTMFLV